MRFDHRRVAVLRNQRGLTRTEFATLTGLSRSLIAMIENGQRGKRPSKQTLEALARGCRCEPEAFFVLDEAVA